MKSEEIDTRRAARPARFLKTAVSAFVFILLCACTGAGSVKGGVAGAPGAVSATSSEDENSVRAAARSGDVDRVRAAMQRDTQVRRYAPAALEEAVLAGQNQVVSLLVPRYVKANTPIHFSDSGPQTATEIAAWTAQPATLRLLIALDGSPSRDRLRGIAHLFAGRQQHPGGPNAKKRTEPELSRARSEVVEILRGRKWLDVNEKSGRYDGKTALSRAVSFRNLDLVRSLLKAGADPYADSPNAIDLATRYRFKDVEAVLRASTAARGTARR